MFLNDILGKGCWVKSGIKGWSLFKVDECNVKFFLFNIICYLGCLVFYWKGSLFVCFLKLSFLVFFKRVL